MAEDRIQIAPEDPGFTSIMLDNSLDNPSINEAATVEVVQIQQCHSAVPPLSQIPLEYPKTEEEILRILNDHFISSTSKCCSGGDSKYLLAHIKILEMTPHHAYRYVLESSIENRRLFIKCEPFTDPCIDHNDFVDPAAPCSKEEKWEIQPPCPEPPLFTESKLVVKVPGSQNIVDCLTCQASGYVMCRSCNGIGFQACVSCSGTGRKRVSQQDSTKEECWHIENCQECLGSARKPCKSSCQLGRSVCDKCRGHKLLKIWKQLEIVCDVVLRRFVTGRGSLSDYILEKADDEVVIATVESLPSDTFPLEVAMESKLNATAVKMINEQLGSQDGERRVKKFRQRLEVIPVVKVRFSWKGEEDQFWVFGRSKLVEFPRGRPGSCCCTIL